MTSLRFFIVFLFFILTACGSMHTPPEHQKNMKPLPTITGKQQVSLLLPLNGHLQEKASAIRDGFFAAYYQDPSKASITLIDTASHTMSENYKKASEQTTTFIVGPLEKNQVKFLANQTQLPITTLALNYSEGSLPPQLIEFGLSPLDEITQVTALAKQAGHRKVLIVTSADAWGKNMKKQFSENWENLGGKIVADFSLSPEQNILDQLQTLVPDMENANKLKTPRFDAVLLAANPEQARSLAALFRFYGLNTIPIYATSSVYSGMASAEDKDLEGVYFCDIPWVINPTPEMQHATSQLKALHPEAGFDIRLYALGLDAYRLIYQLPYLSSNKNAHYEGVTGTLRLKNQRITRTLTCGQFVNGQIASLS